MDQGLIGRVPVDNVLGPLLDKLPPEQRNAALRDIAAGLRREDDLVVAAWILSAEANDPDEALETSIRDFLISLRDAGSAAAVAKLCQRFPKAAKWLVASTTSQLKEALYVVALYFAQDAPVELDERAAISASGHAAIVNKTIALNHLQFLLNIFEGSLHESSLDLDTSQLNVIFTALSASDLDILRCARNVCASLLRTSYIQTIATSGSNLTNGVSIHETLWQWIEVLTIHGRQNIQVSVGFFLWSRMLELPVNVKHLQRLVTNHEYWVRVQKAMINGDMELRRLSVLILRRTIGLAASNNMEIEDSYLMLDRSPAQKERVIGDFEKFCTVYETIVLGRYFNQVKDCVPTLDQLAMPGSVLPTPWILTVLHPSVSNLMQESIRNLLGDWVMTRHFHAGSSFGAFSELLQDRILPWAAQGGLFTTSVSGSRLSCQCEHGEKLADFVKSLLSTKETTNSAEASSRHLQTTIAFLEKSRHNISVYALAYLTYGVYKAALSGPLPGLTTSELLTLADIPFTHGVQDVIQDLTAIMCHAIIRQIRAAMQSTFPQSDDKANLALFTKLQKLETKVESLQARVEDVKEPANAEWASLQDFYATVESSRHTCLTGSGLLKACHSLPELMGVEAVKTCNEELAIKSLDALWDEVEIQDYPRVVLLALPRIWLSPLCLQLCQDSEEILSRLHSFINTFQAMCSGRIYVWTPFMLALRQAVISHPHVAVTLGMSNIIASNINKAPAARHEFKLDAAIARLTTSVGREFSHLTYQHYYGQIETLGFAAFFDLINRVDSLDSSLSDQLLEDVMDPWIRQKLPAPVVSKWKTTEQLQTMLILLESDGIRRDPSAGARYLAHLLHLLKAEPMPRYRFLIEVMISSLLSKHAHLIENLFHILSSNDHHGNPKYMASVMRITVFVVCSKAGTEQMALSFIERVLALTSSAKIIIRHEAQWSFPIFWDFAEQQNWTSIIENPALLGLNRYIRSLDKQMHPLPERENSMFEIDTDCTLVNVLCGRHLWIEPATTPLLGFEDLEELDKLDKYLGFTPNQLSTASLLWGTRPSESARRSTTTQGADAAMSTATATAPAQVTQLALQTKGTSYLSASISDFKTTRQQSSLIVVGSLVDNPYNLGGISRVSEIFGAATMYMSSLNVLTNKDFESVAVSSHLHMHVEALKIADMVAFFGKKRLEGFSVVGIEQTDRSCMLGHDQTKLPKKTILVLGAEKEGMPANILAECDLLVEIPQKGYTRSLNVQTAAACVLHEYCRQHP